MLQADIRRLQHRIQHVGDDDDVGARIVEQVVELAGRVERIDLRHNPPARSVP